MNPEEIQAAIAAAIAPFAEKLSAIEAAVAAIKPAAVEDEEMSAKTADAVKKAAAEAALSVVREFAASLPAPVKFSAPAPEPKAETFEGLVRELKAAGTKHNDAVRKVMGEKPELYATYLSRAQKGEVILF